MSFSQWINVQRSKQKRRHRFIFERILLVRTLKRNQNDKFISCASICIWVMSLQSIGSNAICLSWWGTFSQQIEFYTTCQIEWMKTRTGQSGFRKPSYFTFQPVICGLKAPEFISQVLTSAAKVLFKGQLSSFLNNSSSLLSFGNWEQEINFTCMAPLSIFTASVSQATFTL